MTRTIKYALYIERKDVVPAFLFREAIYRETNQAPNMDADRMLEYVLFIRRAP